LRPFGPRLYKLGDLIMNFYDRVLSILEMSSEDAAKRKEAGEQARLRKRGEGNTDAKAEADAARDARQKVLTTDKDEEEPLDVVDAEDTMESKKKKGVKEADAYGLNKDYDKIPQHMKDAAKEKAKKERDDVRAKAGLDPVDDGDGGGDGGDGDGDGDDKPSVNASKKRKVKETTSGQSSRPHRPKRGSLAHESPEDRMSSGGFPRAGDPEPDDDGGDGDGDDKPKKTEAKKAKKDDKWIQKAVDPDHEGFCTPMTKKTCTPKRKALAKTFKKMGKKRDKAITAKDEK